MKVVNQNYKKNITEVYKIITLLSEEDRAKIPQKIQDFFRDNSNMYLFDEIEMNSEIVKHQLSTTTKKLLKLVEVYLVQ